MLVSIRLHGRGYGRPDDVRLLLNRPPDPLLQVYAGQMRSQHLSFPLHRCLGRHLP